MNGSYLFDTNAAVYYLQGCSSWVDFIDNAAMTSRFASVITRMELLSYPRMEQNAEEGIRSFLSDLTIIPLNDAIENTAIAMRRTARLKLPDAIIAATAVNLGATVITGDRHLLEFDWAGLHTVNPAE